MLASAILEEVIYSNFLNDVEKKEYIWMYLFWDHEKYLSYH